MRLGDRGPRVVKDQILALTVVAGAIAVGWSWSGSRCLTRTGRDRGAGRRTADRVGRITPATAARAAITAGSAGMAIPLAMVAAVMVEATGAAAMEAGVMAEAVATDGLGL